MPGGGHKRTAGAACRAGAFVAVLLVLGVAWMHTLAMAPLPAGGYAGGHTRMAMAAAPHCVAGEHGTPCRDAPHGSGHAASMCQSTPPAAEGMHIPALTPSPLTAPRPATRAWPATTAVDAAAGSGCGPPSLTMLSISRT
ncbi:hypothetical protein GCM10010532_111050 [Dactylosporangium siamense]|uniref:Uncharacterized protein n=1 Tax=Dactylosporangium siamense TaxID=685454 RepID=A0A919PZI7_9ACTN|nr:hypothetical protein Dsi01nite_109900 [Dactylosporangium siamense]